jgi:hypothetical protein
VRAYVRTDGAEVPPPLAAFLDAQLDMLEPHLSAVYAEHAYNHLVFGWPMPAARAMADQVLARARLVGDWPTEAA